MVYVVDPIEKTTRKLQPSDSMTSLLSVEFVADQSGVVAATADGSVLVWSLDSNATKVERKISYIPGDGPVQVARIIRIGGREHLVVARGSVWSIISLLDGKPLLFHDTGNSDILDIAVSGDQQYFATGHNNGMACIWTPTDKKCLLKLPICKGGILNLAFSPDSRRVATASIDGTIRLTEVAKANQRTFNQSHEQGGVVGSIIAMETDYSKLRLDGPVFCRPNLNSLLISCSNHSKAWCYNTLLGAAFPALLTSAESNGRSIAISFDSRYLAVANKCYDLTTGGVIYDFKEFGRNLDHGIVDFCFRANGELVALNESGGIDVISMPGHPPRSMQRSAETGIVRGKISNDGYSSAIGYIDGSIRLITLSNDSSKPQIGSLMSGKKNDGLVTKVLKKGVLSLSYSANNKLIAAGSRNGELALISALDAKIVNSINLPFSELFAGWGQWNICGCIQP